MANEVGKIPSFFYRWITEQGWTHQIIKSVIGRSFELIDNIVIHDDLSVSVTVRLSPEAIDKACGTILEEIEGVPEIRDSNSCKGVTVPPDGTIRVKDFAVVSTK